MKQRHITIASICILLLLALFFGIVVYQSIRDQNLATRSSDTAIELDFETLELADDPDERQKGLQYREGICDTCGVWFEFESERDRVFWMPNVPFSIDIIFLDQEGKIVTIAPNAKPNQITERYYSKPAQYVLEVRAGYAADQEMEEGDYIDLPHLRPQFVEFDNSYASL